MAGYDRIGDDKGGKSLMAEQSVASDFYLYCQQLFRYLRVHFYRGAIKFEFGKGLVVSGLYRKRGKYAQPFLHAAMTAVVFFGFAFGPTVFAQAFPGKDEQASMWEGGSENGEVLGATTLENGEVVTIISDKPRAEIIEYTVREGDTVSSIAKRFDLSTDSIKWLNPDQNWKVIKPGQTIKIPPVDGVVHKVQPGETIYSVAKKYNADAQAMADFPFNNFRDDNFGITVGQTIIVPDGEMPDKPAEQPRTTRYAQTLTPDAGSVSATGNFAWPAYGRITQGFRWYHRAIDIANKEGGPIKASDAGTVVTAGWSNVGYGNYVILEHGNGYRTLYAHLSSLSVGAGQRVNRGDLLGSMGNTGRSTGTHLHFEIIRAGVGNLDPNGFLK